MRADVAGFRRRVTNAFNAAAVTTVIDDADASFAIGNKRLFVIDDSNAAAVFQFVSANAEAVLTVDKLFLVAEMDACTVAVTVLTGDDFVLGRASGPRQAARAGPRRPCGRSFRQAPAR